MKTACIQNNLSDALTIAGRAVASRATLPVTQNVLISTEPDRLRVSSTNLEISITTSIPASVEEEGAATIPAKLLTDFVNSLQGDRVNLSMEPDHPMIKVVAGHSEANINGTKAEEFPPLPPITDDSAVIVMDPATVRNAIFRTAFAAATEESRPVLTGVQLKLSENRFTMTAADGFRLAVQKGDLPTAVDEDISLIIPAKSLTELHRLLNDHNESLELIVSKERRNAMFRVQGKETVELTTLLIQGTFPNTEQLIPQSHNTRAMIDAPAILRAVRTAAIFAKESSNIIRLEMDAPDGEENPQAKLTVSAQSEQLGDEHEDMTIIDIEGESNRIAFNSRYLLDLFTVMDKGQIALETTTSSSPGVFKLTDNDDYVHVVMPMFVQW